MYSSGAYIDGERCARRLSILYVAIGAWRSWAARADGYEREYALAKRDACYASTRKVQASYAREAKFYLDAHSQCLPRLPQAQHAGILEAVARVAMRRMPLATKRETDGIKVNAMSLKVWGARIRKAWIEGDDEPTDDNFVKLCGLRNCVDASHAANTFFEYTWQLGQCGDAEVVCVGDECGGVRKFECVTERVVSFKTLRELK